MVRAERLAVVVVDAQEREVERVARVGEVVGVAAEEAEGLLGRHHEADVGVAPERVGRVAPAVVERDELDDEARVLAPEAGQHAGLGGRGGGVGVEAAVDQAEHLVGHVLDGDELVHVHARHGPLLAGGAGGCEGSQAGGD